MTPVDEERLASFNGEHHLIVGLVTALKDNNYNSKLIQQLCFTVIS